MSATTKPVTEPSAEKQKQVFQVFISAPIEQVWETLTKEGKPLPFFFGSVLHTTGLAPGAPIRMRTPDNKYTGVVGEVLECEPPHRYSHTFKFTNLDDPPCKVTYVLEEVDEGTKFTLISEDVPVGTKSEGYMRQGGDYITKTLKVYVETGKTPFKAKMILFISRVMQPFTPKKSRSENWPL